VGGDTAVGPDADVGVAGRADDQGALAAGVGDGVGVGREGDRRLRVGRVEVAAEGDVDDVDAHVGGGHEGGQLGRGRGEAAPLGDLEGDQLDLGGDAVGPGAVQGGGGDVAADPGAVAVPVGRGRPAELGGQVLVGLAEQGLADRLVASRTVRSMTWVSLEASSVWVKSRPVSATPTVTAGLPAVFSQPWGRPMRR
jgi:hypothetical protein